MKGFLPVTQEKKQHRIPMAASNDVTNFDDPIEARRYIAGWVCNYKRITGKLIEYVDTNAGRIHLDLMTDSDAIFVAKEFCRMEKEVGK